MAQEVQVEHKLHTALLQIKEGLGFAVQIAQLKVFLIGGGAGVVAACTVDQDIAGAEVLQNSLMDFFAADLFQHVAAVGPSLTAFLTNAFGDLFGSGFVKIQHGDLCAGCGQSLAEHAAQHAAGTGDHGNFSGKIRIKRQFHKKSSFLLNKC